MATDGKINIYITEGDLPDELGKGGGGDKGPQKDGKSKSSPLSRYLEHEVMHLIKSSVNTMLTFSINQIGNLRGDYALQRDVSNAVNMGKQMMSVGVAAFAGFKTTGSPIGAAVGAGVAIMGNTLGGLINIHNKTIENRKQNFEIAQLRERAGMNALLDGSRGTLE